MRKRFAVGDCFIPELIVGGEIFREAMNIVRPPIEAEGRRINRIGALLIGTVNGDIHDLGKNLVAVIFATGGFEVMDLGKDIPAERFVAEVERLKPDIVGLSALLTSTKAAQLRDRVRVIVGGAPVNQGWAERIGADAYGADAIDGLRKAKTLLGKIWERARQRRWMCDRAFPF